MSLELLISQIIAEQGLTAGVLIIHLWRTERRISRLEKYHMEEIK